jgi:hypothetical protein
MNLVEQSSRVFTSKSACETAGNQMADTTKYPGDNLRSMSICIPQSAFNE